MLRTAEELDRLVPEWEALLARSASDTIFLSPDWLRSWWAAYGSGRELIVLRVVSDGSLVGLALLYRGLGQLVPGMRHRTLVLLGDGSADSDYLDWISARGHEGTVVAGIIDGLRTSVPGWDLLLLNEIPETSPHLAPLLAEATMRGWLWHDWRVPCARVSLPASWDAYVKSLKPRMRTKVRSVLRVMDEEFHGRCDRLTDRSELEARLESLYDLHRRRWEAEGKSGVFQTAAKRDFYALLSRRLLESDRLRFYSLRIGTDYVAHQYCFEYGNRMYLLQEGLDPAWFEHGAGNALRAHVFQDCIARGIAVYDFLGGVTAHKLSWGAETVWSARVTTGPPSWKNRILFGVRGARAVLKKLLRPERLSEGAG
ncbi:MAG TPA: GNAT family N-acetyltransferase [Candidatus Eisenbacteria bacterium]|nr:GNAT family N-acetyltransferase [Candidatus Eisenbacteria bacterium]